MSYLFDQNDIEKAQSALANYLSHLKKITYRIYPEMYSTDFICISVHFKKEFCQLVHKHTI